MFFNQHNWYKINFDLVWELYPTTNFDFQNCKWFHIPVFPLPDNWWFSSTDLLVTLPGLNGDISLSKPDGFYLCKGIKTINLNSTKHIFDDYSNGFNDKHHQGWARYSFHLKMWNPSPDGYSGDTLVTLLEALTIGLFILAEETDKGVLYE